MNKIHITILSILIVLVGCEDFLTRAPSDVYSESTVFQSEGDMIAALNHLYTFLPEPDVESNGDIVPYVWTDDAVRRSVNGDVRGSDLSWASSHNYLNNFYNYGQIRDINEFITRLASAELGNIELAQRMEKEARFIRAFIYGRMVFAYGGVPLLKEPTDPDFFPERAPRQEVFDFVISELDAIDDLPTANEYAASDKGRITRGAVLAVKARNYLNAVGWHPDKDAMYAGAEAACEAIVDSDVYALEDGIEGFKYVFTKESNGNSSETILANQYVENLRTHLLSRRLPPKGTYTGPGGPSTNQSRIGATANLIEAFQTTNGLAPAKDPQYDPANPWENRDPRFRASFILPGDILPAKGSGELTYEFQPHPNINPSGTIDNITSRVNPTGYNIRKYVDFSLQSTAQDYTNYKIIRYAEVLLMYAEALAGQDKNDEALTYLNMVRERVDMPAYTLGNLPEVDASTGDELIDAILLERRFEFVAEGPHRWFDIWRYKLGSQVFSEGVVYGIPKSTSEPGDLNGEKYVAMEKNWDDKLYLLPIPLSAIDANDNLTQNPDY